MVSPDATLDVSLDEQGICAPGDVTLTVANSQSGLTYQVFNGDPAGSGVAVGSPRVGTGGDIDFTFLGSVFGPGMHQLFVQVSGSGCGNTTLNDSEQLYVADPPDLTPTVTAD